MDHAEVRELLEVAAAEPRGLHLLLGGASAEGAAVAAHLAGCEACRAELDALRHTRDVVADVVQMTPRLELRDQTLQYVAAVGRARPVEAAGDVAALPGIAPAGASTVDPRAPRAPRADVPRWTFRWPSFAWVATFASGAAAAVLITAIVMGQAYDKGLSSANAAIAEQQHSITALTNVADWSMRLAGDPDAETVRLTSASGTNAATAVYSMAAHEMLMVANSLAAPTSDKEYRCWVEAGGTRTLVGKMYFAGDLAYWAGKAGALPETRGPLTFGVSLVPIASAGLEGGQVVLTGTST